MNNKMSIILLALAMVLILAACQAVPSAGSALAAGQTPPTISVSGAGKVYITPDVAYVNIGVQSQDENVGKALAANNEKAAAISAKLQELGVDAKDIQTSSFNIYPNQQYSPEGQPTSILYVVDNTVTVTVRDLTSLGKLLDEVVSAGANSINGINFDVIDRASAVSEARKLAVADARVQADEIAAAAGVQISELYNLSVYINSGPTPLYDAKGGVSASVGQVPVSAGQLAIEVNVSASYLFK